MTENRAALSRVALIRDGGALLALRVIFVGLEFAAGVVLARMLGASEFGVYAFVVAVVALLVGPVALGLDRLLVREVSTAASRGDLREVARAYVETGRLVLAAGAGAFALCLLVSFAWSSLRELALPLAVGLAFMVIQAHGKLRQSVLQALGRPMRAFAPEMLVQPVLFVGSVVLCHLVLDRPRSGLEALTLCAVSVCAANLIGRIWLASSISLADPPARHLRGGAVWLRRGTPFLAIIAANTVLTNIDSVVVGAIIGPTDAGIYRVASQMATFIAFPVAVASALLAPKIAAAYAENRLHEVRQDARTAGYAVVTISGFIFLGLILLGPWVLRIYGPDFEAAYPSLVLLSIAYMANAVAGVAGYVLVMTRYEKLAARTFSFAALGIAAGCFILVPAYGMLGAALATSAGVLALSVALAWLAYEHLDFGPFGLRSKEKAI